MAKTHRSLTISIDFDGTLAEHEYPAIGKEIPQAVDVCKELFAKGYKLVLFTVRPGKALEEAKQWCLDRGLNFYGWNENPDQIFFSNSPKVFANIYIDDSALGCPLAFNGKKRPYVDWKKVRELLVERGIL